MENIVPVSQKPGISLDFSLQGFSDLNMMLNQNGVIQEFKPGYFLTNPLPSIVTGEKIQNLLSPEARHMIEQALESREVTAFEYSITESGRETWFDARIAPIMENRFIFVARDITRCRQAEIKMKQQTQQLALLRSIDLAIASGLDLTLLLNMLLDQVLNLMQVNAAAVLLINPKRNLLEFTSGRGFISNSLQYTHLKLGEGCAGRVASERKMLSIPDLRQNMMEFNRSPLFKTEGFVTYYGVPLIARGRILGVMEIFHRSILQPDSDWLKFLNSIAGQAAIAIDNGMMFRQLYETNMELNQAYDATIEGLMRALDLRDKETQEHTRRVSDMTVKLAMQTGVAESELIHIRRGAILHDIGKMAIPDQILFKPGPLSAEEWHVMRRHPAIALDLLSSVSYLTPALEIPHWHHEKWDGSGYPDQLQGELIPFSARLFALVDVYDALTSNRPYRDAWSKEQALNYISNQAGLQFDPVLVPTFIQFSDHYN